MAFIPVDFATEIDGTSTSKVVSTSLLSQKLFDFEKRTTDYSAVVANFGRIWYRTDTHLFKTVGKNSDGNYEVRSLTLDSYVLINVPAGLSSTSTSNSITANSTFSCTPSGGTTHDKSQWQISTSPSFSSILQDSGESTSKTTYTFSSLSASTTYYWRVRHKGANGIWSAYTSGQTKATTAITIGTRLPDGSIVFAQSGGYWLACAPATMRSQKPWGLYGTDTGLPNVTSGNDPNTGFYNSSVLDGYGASAEANKWCRDKGSQYFLPNKEELLLLYQNKAIVDANDTSGGAYTLNYIATNGTGPNGASSYCWASTEYDSNNAWVVYMNNGSANDTYKNNTKYWVCPFTRISA